MPTSRKPKLPKKKSGMPSMPQLPMEPPKAPPSELAKSWGEFCVDYPFLKLLGKILLTAAVTAAWIIVLSSIGLGIPAAITSLLDKIPTIGSTLKGIFNFIADLPVHDLAKNIAHFISSLPDKLSFLPGIITTPLKWIGSLCEWALPFALPSFILSFCSSLLNSHNDAVEHAEKNAPSEMKPKEATPAPTDQPEVEMANRDDDKHMKDRGRDRDYDDDRDRRDRDDDRRYRDGDRDRRDRDRDYDDGYERGRRDAERRYR